MGKTQVTSAASDISARKKFERMYRRLGFITILIILSVSAIVTSFLIYRSHQNLKEKVALLVEADTQQLCTNVNSYVQNVETSAALLFSDEEYYTYDATNPRISDYDKSVIEERIFSRIHDIGIMRNFSDFGIVYKDCHVVGWCTKTTQAAYKDADMYAMLEMEIHNDKKEDGWFFGRHENVDKVYYVKKINENAILFASFYNREFKDDFKVSDQLEDMTILLVDENDVVIYSNDEAGIAEKLDQEIVEELDGRENVTIRDKDYIISTVNCENGWRLIAYIPDISFTRANISLAISGAVIALIVAILFVSVAIYCFIKFLAPIDEMFGVLEEDALVDKLSGVLNKRAFEKAVSFVIDNKQYEHVAFIMFDVDNFKNVNDEKGHAYGDLVIKRFGSLLKKNFGSASCIGRLGGDEFAVCLGSDDGETIEEFKNRLVKLFDEYYKMFNVQFEYEKDSLDLGLSGGICAYSSDETDINFDVIYKRADKALYYSKEHGKGILTWYEEVQAYED